MLRGSKVSQSSHQLCLDQILILHETFAEQFGVGGQAGGGQVPDSRMSLFPVSAAQRKSHISEFLTEKKNIKDINVFSHIKYRC